MASVTIRIEFADGDVTAMVEAKTSYPDALDQAKVTALTAFREAVAYTLAVQKTDD